MFELLWRRASRASLIAMVGLGAAVWLGISVGIAFANPADDREPSLRARLADAREGAAAARAGEEAVAGDIEATSRAIDRVEAEIAVSAGELASLETKLARSRSRLRTLENHLRRTTISLERATAARRVAQRKLTHRVVDIYTGGEPDAVAIVLGAASFDEMLDLLETRSRVLDYDADLVASLRRLRARMARERAVAAALRREQLRRTTSLARETDRRRLVHATLTARRDALDSLRATRERSLASIRVERREWEAQAGALESESARVAAMVATSAPATTALAIDEPAPSAPPSPAAPPPATGFVWPVAGTVVSPYGERWGRLHAGVDIAAPAGATIVASAAGSVVYAGSMSGYGLIVVIQHAGGIATAYAHNSANHVVVGQYVAQGQAIAAVGCTGSCFGDHVHFEVRLGGSPVDPMAYL